VRDQSALVWVTPRAVSRSITPASLSREIPGGKCVRQALSMYFRLPVAIYTSTAGTPQTEDDCMRPIPLGTKGTFTLRVLAEHLADRFKDAMLPQVLATPVMILIMENAALAAIRPFLDTGESAVGTVINVRHLAATPVGHDVRAEAEVVKVEGKRIEFKVTASDETEEIGSGTHQRMVIDLRSFNERLGKKRKR
jgi:fluoroacetyl-CoA thioesterase